MADATPNMSIEQMLDQEKTDELIDRTAWIWSRRKARNQDEQEDLYQDIQARLREELPRHEPHKGNLVAYLNFHANMVDKKSLNSALSMSRDDQQRYRKLLGSNETYDSFIHAAEATGANRHDANVVWLNAGPSDPYEATFADVDSDFFGDELAITGSDVEDEVINADTLHEVLALFAESCEPNHYRVWCLRNQLDWTFQEIGRSLDPPKSGPQAHRYFKKAEAALHALGAVYWNNEQSKTEARGA